MVAPPEVHGLGQQRFVVGPDVEQDRQRARRVDPAGHGIERQLADRDAHPADPEITETEDPLAVGHDDHVDVVVPVECILEQFVDALAQRPRQVQAALPPDPPRRSGSGARDQAVSVRSQSTVKATP